MSNPIKNYNLTDSSIKPKIFNADFIQPKTQLKISEFTTPIFEKAKDLYFCYIQPPVSLITNTPSTLIQKTMEVSNWIFETSASSLIKNYFQGVHNFNLFNSKTWNLVTPSEVTTCVKLQEPSYKDFEISSPIIIDHTNTPINTTAFSIEQITKDFHRTEIFVNNFHCLNIEDFTSHLGLTLNTTKTDILSTHNPTISKILHFSHQGLFSTGLANLQQLVMRYPNKFPAQIQNKPLTIHIRWNPDSIETTKILGEVSFHVKCTKTANILPYAYTVKIVCSLDKEQIFWEAIKEDPIESQETEEEDIESSSVKIDNDKSEEMEELDYGFVEMIACEEDVSDPDFDRTLHNLLHNTNSGLQPGMTSKYLTTLKNKYINFVYNDRLMYGNVPVTTDTIVDSLTDLKKEYPSDSVIFLPFLVKGWTVDHAVVAVINLANETIEYFDPKGQSWFITRAEKQSNNNVFDFLTEIGQKVISPNFSKEKILYNKKNVPQGSLDNINCGAFCLQFMEERIKHTFDDIENGTVDKFTNPVHIRYQIANNLIKNTYS